MNYLRLIYSLAICQFAGIVGSFFNNPLWYATLTKPGFTPPDWVFAPVWIVLFIMMGVSLYFIWDYRPALTAFTIQLLLNISWSVIFFGLRQPLYALVEIILLWISILVTVLRSYKVSKQAGYLLVPYLLWVSFAAVLNLAIVLVN